MAAFFNKESEVKGLTDKSAKRWSDQSANVNVYPKPKVVVLESYSTGSWGAPGWQVAVSQHRLHGWVQMCAGLHKDRASDLASAAAPLLTSSLWVIDM